MSVVTFYGRLTIEQYEAMRVSPEGLAQFSDGTISTEQLLYLDKATPMIGMNLEALAEDGHINFARPLSSNNSVVGLSADAATPNKVQDSKHWIATCIEGSGDCDRELDDGMGPAWIVSSDKVKLFNQVLNGINENILRLGHDFEFDEENDDLNTDEPNPEEEIFSNFILPSFLELKQFYALAAQHNQMVLIWYA